MKDTVCFVLSFSGNINPFNIFQKDGLYGSEYAVYETAKRLVNDYNVYITINQPSGVYIRHDGINYLSECDFNEWSFFTKPKHVVIVRYLSPFFRLNLKYVSNIYYWVHDILPLFHDPFINIPMETINLTNRLCKRYISVGSQCIDNFYKPKWGMDKEKFTVIKNGINLEKDWTFEKVLSSPRISLSFVWSSSEGKGVWNLLNFWPKILEKFPTATLHLCYGFDNPKIQEFIKDYSSIINHGKMLQSDLFNLYKTIDYWFFPNKDQETCGTSCFETAYYGPLQITNTNGPLVENVSGCKILMNDFFYEIVLQGIQFFEENPFEKEKIRKRQYDFAIQNSWDSRIVTWKNLFS